MELFTRVMRSILRVSTFFLGILPPLPEGQKFIGGFPTPNGFFFRRFELAKRLEGGFYHVKDIGAPHRFGENVTISGSLEDGAHATRSDNAGTSRSRFQQYLGAGRAADNLMPPTLRSQLVSRPPAYAVGHRQPTCPGAAAPGHVRRAASRVSLLSLLSLLSPPPRLAPR